jgi:hypothetical protein
MFSPYRPHEPFTVDLTVGKEQETVVELDRGRTAARTIVDADGKALTGLVTAGLAVHKNLYGSNLVTLKLPDHVSTATIYGMGPNEIREVLFVHPEKKLARFAFVKADTKQSIKLWPLQPVKGRFTDTDGRPLAGLTVSLDYGESSITHALTENTKFTTTATTDADGRFVLPDVVPGTSFSFDIHKGSTRYAGVPRIGTKVMLPGFPLTLDDRKLEPRP